MSKQERTEVVTKPEQRCGGTGERVFGKGENREFSQLCPGCDDCNSGPRRCKGNPGRPQGALGHYQTGAYADIVTREPCTGCSDCEPGPKSEQPSEAAPGYVLAQQIASECMTWQEHAFMETRVLDKDTAAEIIDAALDKAGRDAQEDWARVVQSSYQHEKVQRELAEFWHQRAEKAEAERSQARQGEAKLQAKLEKRRRLTHVLELKHEKLLVAYRERLAKLDK